MSYEFLPRRSPWIRISVCSLDAAGRENQSRGHHRSFGDQDDLSHIGTWSAPWTWRDLWLAIREWRWPSTPIAVRVAASEPGHDRWRALGRTPPRDASDDELCHGREATRLTLRLDDGIYPTVALTCYIARLREHVPSPGRLVLIDDENHEGYVLGTVTIESTRTIEIAGRSLVSPDRTIHDVVYRVALVPNRLAVEARDEVEPTFIETHPPRPPASGQPFERQPWQAVTHTVDWGDPPAAPYTNPATTCKPRPDGWWRS